MTPQLEQAFITLLAKPIGYTTFKLKQEVAALGKTNKNNLPLDLFTKNMVIYDTEEQAIANATPPINGQETVATEVYFFMLLTCNFMGYKATVSNTVYDQAIALLNNPTLLNVLSPKFKGIPVKIDGNTQTIAFEIPFLSRPGFGTKLAKYAKKAARHITQKQDE